MSSFFGRLPGASRAQTIDGSALCVCVCMSIAVNKISAYQVELGDGKTMSLELETLDSKFHSEMNLMDMGVCSVWTRLDSYVAVSQVLKIDMRYKKSSRAWPRRKWCWV